MQHLLSKEERQSLALQHRIERDKRVCDRIKAVLLRDEGWDYEQIAHVLLLSSEAVRQHVSDYQKSQKLKPENGGSESKLNIEQTKALLEHLEKQTYLYAKDIVAYVRKTFGMEYTVPGVTNWLEAHGFSYKKPAVVPGKANREAQEQWIREYEALKAQLPPDETICFIDGVHPTHNRLLSKFHSPAKIDLFPKDQILPTHLYTSYMFRRQNLILRKKIDFFRQSEFRKKSNTKTAYGWIRRGERKEIPTNTGQERLNLSGSIDILTKKVFVREDETLNADSTIAFLKMLKNGYPSARKVHVFCDNAKYYKNKNVVAYLITSKVEMHFLPPYGPNLNPIERLWKFMNEHVLYNRYYEKFRDFKKEVIGFLNRLGEMEDDLLRALDKRITDCFRPMGRAAC